MCVESLCVESPNDCALSCIDSTRLSTVVNPLGAARTTHKLALHYVQLLNAPPHVRSDLDVIFLVSVALKTTQDAVGAGEIVQGARNEAQDGTSLGASLRRFDGDAGIAFLMPDQSTQAFRGWLLLVSADTLAAAELIGFKKSFSPNVKSPCWQCNAGGGASLRRACSFHKQGDCMLTLRTPAAYRSQRQQAKTMSSTARAQYEGSLGVNTWQHAYTRIPFFDVITNVPRDLMHVELEGNLKVHLYGFLYMAIVKHKWFSRAELNARIKAFPFFSKVRRPPPIPASALKGRKGTLPRGKGTIPYTSGHMLHFVLHSLEILRPLLSAVALQSAEYKAWVAHVHYFAALMKRSFTDATISAVDALIYRAQRLFLGIAAYSELWKPKNHFAQHIPGDIRLFGPPRTYWCMRFEAKNQDHKRAANTGNFKNTPGTVAKFWAERSAHRLTKKRKRTFIATESKGTVCLDGMELTAGMWVVFKRPGPVKEKLAKIQSIAYGEDGAIIGVNAESFDFDSVLEDDSDGGMCAEAEALENGGQSIVIPLESGCINVLLAVKHEGLVWFVEQP